MRLVKSRLNALAGVKRFVAGKAACDRTIKERAGQRVLHPGTYAQPFQAAHIQDDVSAAGAGRMKVNGQKQPGDADFMVLKTVMPGVRVRVHFKRHLRMKFLLYADFKIILRISPNVAYALVRISGIVADK